MEKNFGKIKFFLRLFAFIILTIVAIFTLNLFTPDGFVVCLYLMCIVSIFLLASVLMIGINRGSSLENIKVYSFVYSMIFAISSYFMFFFMSYRNPFYIKLYDLICFEDFVISFDLYISNQSVLMSYVVMSVSYFVSMFSIWYLRNDPNCLKFLVLITYFTFFMLILVNASNLIILFIGWEGIGIFSYLLINFWNTRSSANRSALKAVLFNKIGDCCLYLFLFLYWFAFKTFNTQESFNLLSLLKHDSSFFNAGFEKLILIFLVIASMAKSAQIILHVWLPDAMEGPTPVSALLHAATMVTAGIFMLIKFNHIFGYNDDLYKIVLWVGLATNFIASITALFQNDIKKIVAYSTASQIGIIYIAFGTGNANLSFFHIINHAYFKAFLFVLSGIIIHNYFNNQDIRNYNKLNKNRYFVYVCFLICSFSLFSVPYFSGYYSKESIINSAYLGCDFSGYAAYYLLCLSAVTTSLYTMKILYYLFFSVKAQIIYRGNDIKTYQIDYFYVLLFIIISILLLFTVFIGFFMSSYHKYWQVIASQEYADVLMKFQFGFLAEYLEISNLYLSYFAILGLFFLIILIKYNYFLNKNFSFLKDAASRKFFFNDIYTSTAKFMLEGSSFVSYFIDKSFIENFTKYPFSIFKRLKLYIKKNYLKIFMQILCILFLSAEACVLSYFGFFSLVDALLTIFAYWIAKDIADRILKKRGKNGKNK